MLKKEKYFCIFGGGAIRGLTYVGAVRALKEKNVEFTGFAGSSAGSIAAVLTALDYTSEEMSEIFMHFDYTLFRDINFSFKFELALSKGEVFTDKIREIIAKKLGTDRPITFNDFPKNLYILASNLSTGKCVIFSKETTPDFEVALAVRISAGFPGLMNPYELKGEYYVDGDLGKAYALSQISPLLDPKDCKVLEFRLEGAKRQPPSKNPLVYLNNAMDFLCNSATDNVISLYENKEKYDIVVLETKDTLLFDLNIPKEHREYLIQLGYDITKEYFEKILPKKNEQLISVYKILENNIKNIYDAVLKREYQTAKEISTEFFVNNYRKLNDIDEDIVEKTEELIKSLINNKTKKIFLIPIANNHAEIKDKISNLEKMLKNKILSLSNY